MEYLPVYGPLIFTWQATRAVTADRYYLAPYFYAYFCTLLNLDNHKEIALPDYGIILTPLEQGVVSFLPGEKLRYHVVFSSERMLRFCFERFMNANDVEYDGGFTDNFAPLGVHIAGDLEQDSLSGKEICLAIKQAASELSQLQSITLRFPTPLRLKRESSQNNSRDEYMDTTSFEIEAVFRACWRRIYIYNNFVQTGQINPGYVPECPLSLPKDLKVISQRFMQVGVPPSKKNAEKKDYYEGIVGDVTVSGSISSEWLSILLMGGFLHIGNRGAFGLGRMEIPEAGEIMQHYYDPQPASFLDRALSTERLKQARDSLKGDSAGPDEIAGSDMRRADDTFLNQLACDLRESSYKAGDLRSVLIPKKDGNTREITIPNATDRLLQRAVTDLLSPAINTLLSASSLAYRRGLNREGAAAAVAKTVRSGFTQAIKADISSFFDSVRWRDLEERLGALFGNDPVNILLMNWVKASVKRNGQIHRRERGLPQGLPVSPMLANLLLDQFDRDMETAGLKLVRYCDDFIVLMKPMADEATALTKIRGSLAALGLSLNESKTRTLDTREGFRFLGLSIVPDNASTDLP